MKFHLLPTASRHAVQFLFGAFLALTTTSLQAVEGSSYLTPEGLVDLKKVSSVTLGPNGERAAYLLTVPRASGDAPGDTYRQLWVAHFKTGKTRRFTQGKERVSAPAFSPDGKSITFQVKRPAVDENTQVYSIRVRGGEARLLTRHPTSVSNHVWSPDGRSIAFTAPPEESAEEKKAQDNGQDWTDHDQDHTPDGLWIFDVKSKKSRLVFDHMVSTVHVQSAVWTPDSKDLIFKGSPTPTADDEMMLSQLYRVAASGGTPRQIVETPGKLGAFVVSPDGQRLAFLGAVSQNDPIAQSLFVLRFDEGVAMNLTEEYDGSAERLDWWDDETLFLISVEREKNAVYKVDAKSGQRTPLEWPNLIISGFDLGVANDQLAVAAHSATHPTEIFVGRADGSDLKRVNNHNPDLDSSRLAHQEVVSWTGADGWEISGILTYPRGFKEGMRYPLVLQVHGGPEGVSLDGWTSTATYPVQLLADAGFMVLQPNYRGSMGRGVAFSKADHDDLGGKEFNDVLAGIDDLVERGWVDPERVGTGGWSYGGYFSAWAATRHSERFRASVVGAGLTNWIAFAGTTDIPREMALVHWNSWWYDEPELHWQRSPLAHINKARTPTLLLHGADDSRVHPEQSQELYSALRQKGVPTRYMLYPREGHGLDERAHQLDAIGRVLDWFGEYLKIPDVQGIEEPTN